MPNCKEMMLGLFSMFIVRVFCIVSISMQTQTGNWQRTRAKKKKKYWLPKRKVFLSVVCAAFGLFLPLSKKSFSIWSKHTDVEDTKGFLTNLWVHTHTRVFCTGCAQINEIWSLKQLQIHFSVIFGTLSIALSTKKLDVLADGGT